MDLTECFRKANGDAEEACQTEWLPLISLKNPIKGLTARISKYEDCLPFVTSKRQGLDCPRGIEFGRE
jgi:hypothetical protein